MRVVRATQRGYYRDAIRRPNDVFELVRPEDFSARWMTPVADDTPEQRTSAQQALSAEHARSSPLGATRVVSAPADPDDRADTDFDPFK